MRIEIPSRKQLINLEHVVSIQNIEDVQVLISMSSGEDMVIESDNPEKVKEFFDSINELIGKSMFDKALLNIF